MSSSGSYPIEEFLEAITAQLDQTQDALRLKAVNRPLTFALKDFNVDLKVFVEMNPQGRVAFRPAAPNEEGASTVSIGFTTITRPMVEENTISMEMAQAPSLAELGLENDERRQLAKIGVRNAVQLRNLQRSAGEDALSRHTGVDLGRIRQALDLAKPQMTGVISAPPDMAPPPKPVAPTPKPMPTPPRNTPDIPPKGYLADRIRKGLDTPTIQPKSPKRLQLKPGAKNIRLQGRNLIDGGRIPKAKLDGRTLEVLEANMQSIAFALPIGIDTGHLNIEMPDGSTEDYDVIPAPYNGGLQ